jgi:hypothetical protein
MDRRQVAYLIASTILIGVWVALRPSVWPLILLLVILIRRVIQLDARTLGF